MKQSALILTVIMLLSMGTMAAESPQFRGPDRSGSFPETGLMKSWPEGGPEIAWAAEGIGKGYASLCVLEDAIYVPGMFEDDMGFICVLNHDGTLRHRFAYGRETLDKQAPGPRSTPTIEEDRLYMLSGLGVAYCFRIPDGELIWKVDFPERFNAKKIQWDLAESLLIDGDKVICTPGGPDAVVAALNKMTGETVWTAKGLTDKASYCSPDIIEHNGRRIIVTMTAKLVVGIDPETGQTLWQHRHETDWDVHAVTPKYRDGLLFYTAGYGSGSGVLKLSEDGAAITEVWADKTLDCQHHGTVLVGGYIYGTSHQNAERGLVCLEMATGKVMWTTREVRTGVTVYADGMLYIYEGPKRGNLCLVKATPEGFEQTGSFHVDQGTDKHWAHPVIANGKLFVRHGDVLIAYNIKAE
jgi:outer membrane protein assembly factor BamB